MHDDALNWTTAKSLASGSGYRILSLPGQPAQTKYPPVYSLILSAAWRLNPQFPDNLTLAIALNWLIFAAFAVALERFLAAAGVEHEPRFLLCVLLLFNRSTLDLVYTLWPDALFEALVLCALIVLEKRVANGADTAFAPLFAGCLAALAFLSKGAALPLLFTCPVVLFYKRRWKAALYFVAGWAPFLACWYAWVARGRIAGNDIATIYYTNYFKLFLATTPLSALRVIIPINLALYLTSLGASFGLGSWHSAGGLAGGAAALLFGVIGLHKALNRGHLAFSAAFALGATAMVTVWHYPPTERYVLPALPVLMAGAGLQLGWMIRQRTWARTILRGLTGAVFAALLYGVIARASSMDAGFAAEMAHYDPHINGWPPTSLRMLAYCPRRTRCFICIPACVATVSSNRRPISFTQPMRFNECMWFAVWSNICPSTG